MLWELSSPSMRALLCTRFFGSMGRLRPLPVLLVSLVAGATCVLRLTRSQKHLKVYRARKHGVFHAKMIGIHSGLLAVRDAAHGFK